MAFISNSNYLLWPENTNLQPVTQKGQSVRFEPLLEDDSSSVTTLIAEQFMPDEPLLRAAGAGRSLLSAKTNPEDAESVEFWRQTRAFVDSAFIVPAFTSRPNVSFKVVTTERSSSAAEDQQVLIGVALAHVEYVEANENLTHPVYAIELFYTSQVKNSGSTAVVQ